MNVSKKNQYSCISQMRFPRVQKIYELKLNLSLILILEFYVVCENEFSVVTAFQCNVNQETLNTEYDIIHSI